MAKYQGKHTTQANKTPSRRKSRRGSRIIPILAAAVFVYAAARLAMGFFYDIKLDREQAELKAAVISTPVPVEDLMPASSPSSAPGPSAAPEATPTPSPSPTPTPEPTPTPLPITVDHAAVKAENGDYIGWLYCEDTPIDFPIVRGEDNEYYLTHTFYGSTNDNGALFMDYRGKEDFSDKINVVYGHNLYTDSMLGSLSGYRQQEYYEQHPSMYLFTAEKNYELDVVCAFDTYVTSPAFVFPCTEGSYGLLIKDIETYSFIEPSVDIIDGEPLLGLSTCTDFDDMRFVVITTLRAIEDN